MSVRENGETVVLSINFITAPDFGQVDPYANNSGAGGLVLARDGFLV